MEGGKDGERRGLLFISSPADAWLNKHKKKRKKGEACNPHSFRIVFLLTAPTDRLVVRYGISSKTIPGRRLLRDPVVQRASRVRSRGPLSQAEKDSSHPPTSCTVAERLGADTKDATHTKKNGAENKSKVGDNRRRQTPFFVVVPAARIPQIESGRNV